MWIPTPEKIYDVYAFKLIKRALKKKFPWIKDVFVRQDDLNNYTTLFLNFEFDPTEFSKAYGHETKAWIQELIDAGYYIDYSYPNLINDMSYEEYKKSVMIRRTEMSLRTPPFLMSLSLITVLLNWGHGISIVSQGNNSLHVHLNFLGMSKHSPHNTIKGWGSYRSMLHNLDYVK
jgi:hypothetical protein